MNCDFCGHGEVRPTGYCVQCNSSARERSFLQILNRLAGGAAALGLSETPRVQERIAQKYPALVSATLFGNYGAGTAMGVDAANLAPFEARTFDLITACAVLDYVENIEAAFQTAARVLRPGGHYAIYIMPERLSDGDAAPRVRERLKRRDDYLQYLPEGYELPDMAYSRDWLLHAMTHAGFRPEIVAVCDAMTGKDHQWFLAHLPVAAGSSSTAS